MSTTAAPVIPPRPARTQQVAAAAGASKLPDIPPRPKRLDRSISPGNYPRSPLNENPFGSNLRKMKSMENSNLNPIPRPPSVHNLPSLGQEGSEYADIQYEPTTSISGLSTDDPTQTRSVGDDIQLHAPKPSLPKSSAKAQVQAVTRTDAYQAASHGFGKPGTPLQEENDFLTHSRTRNSFSRPGSVASTERRRSIVYGEEHGPAELGLRVPINPLLGDVQAPSPAPFSTGLTPMHTGQNGEKRRHSRTKSGREVFLPPGSYGLHGHGVAPVDKFEKDWYAKHPEQLQHEEGHGHGVYENIGSGRGSFALSSDDLNKIVRDTASRGAGYGTSASTMSYPDEQIGYIATDQYATRSQMASPNYLGRVTSNPPTESPLRKTSFPAAESTTEEFRKSNASFSGKSDDAVDSDADLPVHIDEPRRRYNKITGGDGTLNETEDVGPVITHPTEEGGILDEHGYSVPILAEDEVAKEAGSPYMYPAMPPKQDRRGSHLEYEHRGSGDVTPSSRPGSRPGSIYGMHSLSHSLSRFATHHEERDSLHTPLEDVAEYEPLFPDEDGKKKAMGAADRFKQRPDNLKHRFPSQDIWEDTPSSVMYEATVSTPDLPAQGITSKDSSVEKSFEHPDVEAKRKGEVSEEEKKKLIPGDERLAKSVFGAHLRGETATRPPMQQRFPSQDIWEDSPDSQYLVTTVQSPPVEDSPESPTEILSKPAIPPRPNKSKLSELTTPTVPPVVPTRPTKRVEAFSPTESEPSMSEGSPTEIRKVPSIPDRPKPQIPPRPGKKISEGLTKSISSTSTDPGAETEKAVTSPPPTKSKPQIPARPGQGSLIANLKGNFMSDLNQKLGLGPPKEKENEPEAEQEAKPLEDTRKGRARGPQRRAPGKQAASTDDVPAPSFSMFAPKSLWHIDDQGGALTVHSHEDDFKSKEISGSFPEAKPIEQSIQPSQELSDEKISQMDQSTIADTPLPPTIDTTESKFTDDPSTTENNSRPAESIDELKESTPLEPTQEKRNPLENFVQESGESNPLSQRTTASSEAASGHTLEREEPDPNTDAIPISQHTTADTEMSGATLETMKTEG